MLQSTAREVMLSAFASVADLMSLHSGDPASGGLEASGPGYRRAPVSWHVDSDLSNDAEVSWIVGRGRWDHVGFWTRSGLFLASQPCSPRAFNAPAVYVIPVGGIRFGAEL